MHMHLFTGMCVFAAYQNLVNLESNVLCYALKEYHTKYAWFYLIVVNRTEH